MDQLYKLNELNIDKNFIKYKYFINGYDILYDKCLSNNNVITIYYINKTNNTTWYKTLNFDKKDYIIWLRKNKINKLYKQNEY